MGMGIVVARGNGDGTFTALNVDTLSSTIEIRFRRQSNPEYIEMTDRTAMDP